MEEEEEEEAEPLLPAEEPQRGEAEGLRREQRLRGRSLNQSRLQLSEEQRQR